MIVLSPLSKPACDIQYLFLLVVSLFHFCPFFFRPAEALGGVESPRVLYVQRTLFGLSGQVPTRDAERLAACGRSALPRVV